MNGVTHIPFPDPYRPVLNMLPGEDIGSATIRYLEEEIFGKTVPADEVAGVVVEPIQGEGGYIVPPEGFFIQLREVCDRNGILLIVDEVQAGMGRTGKWWSIQNFGVEPDIVATAKGIASGMPLGAMIARKSIATWPKGSHGNTYGGNPLACAAALATLELIENEYLDNAAIVGRYILDRLETIKQAHPSIGSVRGIGLMIGIEFVMNPISKIPAIKLRDRIEHLAFERGLLTLGCGRSVLRISPALCITQAEAETGLQILEEAITIAESEDVFIKEIEDITVEKG
jgi:4-aminobutyrate aminotransferase